MRRAIVLCLGLAALSAACAYAIKITLFSDLDFYIERGKQIVVADCVTSGDPSAHQDGACSAEVNVIRTLKGQTRPGKLAIMTIYPMAPGARYLLYSLAEPPAFQAVPELSVVAIPDRFDLKQLDGKPLAAQLRLIFEARRFRVKQELRDLRHEEELLEKALAAKEVAR